MPGTKALDVRPGRYVDTKAMYAVTTTGARIDRDELARHVDRAVTPPHGDNGFWERA